MYVGSDTDTAHPGPATMSLALPVAAASLVNRVIVPDGVIRPIAFGAAAK